MEPDEQPKELPWDGKSLEEYFMTALENRAQEHPMILKLRYWYPLAWERALERFRGK